MLNFTFDFFKKFAIWVFVTNFVIFIFSTSTFLFVLILKFDFNILIIILSIFEQQLHYLNILSCKLFFLFFSILFFKFYLFVLFVSFHNFNFLIFFFWNCHTICCLTNIKSFFIRVSIFRTFSINYWLWIVEILIQHVCNSY